MRSKGSHRLYAPNSYCLTCVCVQHSSATDVNYKNGKELFFSLPRGPHPHMYHL